MGADPGGRHEARSVDHAWQGWFVAAVFATLQKWRDNHRLDEIRRRDQQRIYRSMRLDEAQRVGGLFGWIDQWPESDRLALQGAAGIFPYVRRLESCPARRRPVLTHYEHGD